MALNESLYMDSYMSTREMKSLSLIVFEIFVKIAFWPLDLGPRWKIMAPNKGPYMVSYMSIIEMKSLALAIMDIFAKITLWPLDIGPRSKVMAPNESPYGCLYVCNRNEVSISRCLKIAFWSLDPKARLWHQMKAHIWFPYLFIVAHLRMGSYHEIGYVCLCMCVSMCVCDGQL